MQNYGDTTPPYPLLVVRPDGIETYGAARKAMLDWDDQFGYELVPADVKLAFSKPDANLKQRVEIAIREAAAKQYARNAIAQRAYSWTRRDTDTEPLRPRIDPVGGCRLSRLHHSIDLVGLAVFILPATTTEPVRRNSGDRPTPVVRHRPQALGMAPRLAIPTAVEGTTVAPTPTWIRPPRHANLPIRCEPRHARCETSRHPIRSPLATTQVSPVAQPMRQTIKPRHPIRMDRIQTDRQKTQAIGAKAHPKRRSKARAACRLTNPSDHKRKHKHKTPCRKLLRSKRLRSRWPRAAARDPAVHNHPHQRLLNPDRTVRRLSSSRCPPRPRRLALTPARSASSFSVKAATGHYHRTWRAWAAIRSSARSECICYPDRLVLLPPANGGATEMFGFSDGDLDRASLELASAVRDRVDRWGASLPGGRWQPRLDVQVVPGGESRFHQLRSLMSGSGVEVTGRASQ